MSVPFNGRVLIQPQVVTAVNTQALAPASPATPYALALVGPANQGPNQWVQVQSVADIIATLGADSDLANAAALALAPSPATNGANPLLVYNVNPTTQGTLDLNNTATTPAASIVCTTTRYGAAANQIKVAVSAGSQQGYKVSVGDDYSGQVLTQDNIALPVLSLAYTGTTLTNVTATVTDSSFTVEAGATPSQVFSISFSTATTVQQLVNQINQQAGFEATLLDPNANDATSGLFDNVTNVAITSTATTFSANVTAVVRSLNSGWQPWVTAVRQANATNLATTGAWVYASGGSTGTATTANWQNAYTALQQQYNVLWVVPVTPNSSYWAMNDAHCQYMASLGYGRYGIVGGTAGTTVQQALSNVASLKSETTGYLVNGTTGTNLQGSSVTFPPYIVAAQLAAMAAGQPLNESLTAKPVAATGLEQSFADSTIDTLTAAGAIVLKQVPWSSVPVVVKGQSTAAANPSGNEDQIQLSAVQEQFVLVRLINQALQPFVGQPITGTTAAKVQQTVFHTLMDAYTQQGLLAQAPTQQGISVSISGTVVTVTAQVALTLPADFILTTLQATLPMAQAA
ncbi:MAG: hypothetical protein K6V97_03865 [Actinomycetia bacterium]|nr:hypothetical protein [Actinomycetes bacterium]